MDEFFIAVGVATMFVFLFFFLVMICDFVDRRVRAFKWAYKYKHRFDKKPTAKCYCKDCVYYDPIGNTLGLCMTYGGKFAHEVTDDGFCNYACPKEKDPDAGKKGKRDESS